MGFAVDWKTAKKAFEESTKKSKPSATFLGVFNKGTGIEAALKDADGAKTADDLRKALGKLSAAASAYLPTLTKAAADPKSIPTDQKPSYVAAIKKLEDALATIKTDGETIASGLEGAGKKDRVDPAALKRNVEAAAHLQLRENGVVEAKKLLASFTAEVAPIEKLVQMSKKARDTAADASRKGDKAAALVQLGVISKCLDQTTKVVKGLESSFDKNVQDESSIIKQGRTDFKDSDKLDAVFKTPYMKKSVAAFAQTTEITIKINKIMAAVKGMQGAISTLHDEAETSAGKTQPAQVYVDRLTKVESGLQSIAQTLGTNIQRVQGIERNATNDQFTMDNKLKSLPSWRERIDQFEDDMENRRKVAGQLKAQSAALPRGARENDQVDRMANRVLATSGTVEENVRTLTAAITAARNALNKLAA